MPETTVGLFGYPSLMKGTQPPEEMLLGNKKIGMMALEKALDLSDHVILVSSSEQQAETMESMAEEHGITVDCRVVEGAGSASDMILTALEMCERDQFLALPSSSPYVSSDLLVLMMELLESREGVFLRGKSGSIYEFLFAVKVEPAKRLLMKSTRPSDLSDLFDGLVRTMAISWTAASALDPMHLSYFVVRTDSDYETAEHLLAKVTRV